MKRSYARWAAILGVLALLPLIVRDSYFAHLVILAFLFAVLASNWDITLGYAGIFNFAHVAVFALGAYASAIATTNLALSPWLGLLVGLVTGGIAGAVAFIPAIRLRGVYVALSTFAFAQISMYLITSQRQITGGTQGKVGIPPLAIGDFSFAADNRLGYLYAAAALLVASTLFLRWLVRSNLGRSLVAIRDAEEYATSRGINVGRQHLLGFVASSLFTGLAGAFYAHYIGAVATDLFGFPYAALLLSMVWFGGVGSIYGPIVGALILTFVSELLAPYGPWRFVVVSLVIIVTLAVLPRGLWGLTSRINRGQVRAG